MTLALLLEVEEPQLTPSHQKLLRSAWLTWTANGRQGSGLRGAEVLPLVRLGLLARREQPGTGWRRDKEGNRKAIPARVWYVFTDNGAALAARLFGENP